MNNMMNIGVICGGSDDIVEIVMKYVEILSLYG